MAVVIVQLHSLNLPTDVNLLTDVNNLSHRVASTVGLVSHLSLTVNNGNGDNNRWSFRRSDSNSNRQDRRPDYRPRQDYTRTADQRSRAPPPVDSRSNSSSSSGRRGPGCFVCGAFDCHSRNHRPQSRDRAPEQHTPSSTDTNPFRQGSPRPPTPAPRRDQGNDVWVPRTGARGPYNHTRQSSR